MKTISEIQDEVSLALLGVRYDTVTEECTEYTILDINRKVADLFLQQCKPEGHRVSDFMGRTERFWDSQCSNIHLAPHSTL